MAEARRLVAAGHELGNHSYSHPRMVLKPLSFIQREVERTDELIRQAGYEGPIHFRAPYTKKLLLLPYYLVKTGRKTITFDVEPETYVSANAAEITRYVLEKVRPGSIILLHVMYESGTESLKSVRPIVVELQERGYRFVTITELMSFEGK